MPANGTWPCATCGTLVFLYEVRGDGCVDCPKLVPGVTPDPVDEPPTVMRVGSLFTGGGGLDMAVRALWPDAEIAWCSEVDPHASRLLAARHPNVPNLGDITAIDWTQVAPVDVLVGGFPCQDISHAGLRAGITEETRSGLWFYFRDAIRTLRPRLVLVENVAAITAAGSGLDVVLGSLAEIGFDAEWGCLRASDIGAPHQRERWFAVAWAADTDGSRQRPTGLRRVPARQSHPEGSTEDAPDSNLSRPQGSREGPREPWAHDGDAGRGDRGDAATPAGVTLPTPTAALSGGVQELERRVVPARGAASMLPTPRASERENRTTRRTPSQERGEHGLYLSVEVQPQHWGDYEAAIRRWEGITGTPAPDPTDTNGRLSPPFVEWLMGWPPGWTNLDDLSRAQRLKILGNGVVPQQAAAAYSVLLERARQPATAVA